MNRSNGTAALALEARGLGKRYRLYSRSHERVLEWVGLRGRGARDFWALRGLDLTVQRGCVLGVCGRNGAGKSTLLKILTGITQPSEGRYRTSGRVQALLELGVGFQPELSGRANLRHQGLLYGMRGAEMQRRIDEIIEFAELGHFIDEPVRTYSSGMAMRLGFCAATMLDPDILILDEVFAVGDVAFQKKCIDRIHEFTRRNKTILFCSHSIYDLRQLCDEALWLRDGRAHALGDVVDVTGDYFTHLREERDPRAEAAAGARDAGLPCVTDVRCFELDSDREVDRVQTGDSIEIRVWWEKPDGFDDELNLGVGLVREDNIVCVGLGSHFDSVRLEGRSGCMALALPSLQLLSGRYIVTVWLLDETGSHRYHEHLAARRLHVRASTRQMGVYVPEHRWLKRGEDG